MKSSQISQTSKNWKIILVVYGFLFFTGINYTFSALKPTNRIDAGENIKCIATANAKNPKEIKLGRTQVNKSKQVNFECPNKICIDLYHPDPGEVTIQESSLKEISPRICCVKLGPNKSCIGKEKFDQVAEKPMEFVNPCAPASKLPGPSNNGADRERELNSLS